MDLELKKAIAKKKLQMMGGRDDRPTTYNNNQDVGLELERATNILSGKLKVNADVPSDRSGDVRVSNAGGKASMATQVADSQRGNPDEDNANDLKLEIAKMKMKKRGY